MALASSGLAKESGAAGQDRMGFFRACAPAISKQICLYLSQLAQKLQVPPQFRAICHNLAIFAR